MKRITAMLLLILLFAFISTTPVIAADFALVTDDAGLLSQDEYDELNRLAEKIAEKYLCEVSVVTIDDMGEYSEYSDAYDVAAQIYTEYGFGYGDEKSGMLLFLSMADRDYALVAHGYGNVAFTDYGKDELLDRHVLPLLGDDDYYGAFKTYLNTSAEYLAMARDGEPFDTDTDTKAGTDGFLIKLGISILLPLVIAGIVCAIWYSQMKTAKPARAADMYIPDGGFVLTGREDRFLYRTETRRKIERESSSGGTSIDSGGFSGRSGKF